MSVRNAFSTGLKDVFQNKKMWVILFVIQLLFAVILLFPLRAQWESVLGHSLMGEEILQGYGMMFFVEFIAHFDKVVSMVGSMLLIVGIVFLLVSIFLSGGIFDTFVSKEKYTANRFFGSSGHFFWRFFRLFLFSLPFILIGVLLMKGLGTLSKSIAGDSEPWIVFLTLVRYLILFFLLFFIQMAFDYAKIRTVIEDRRDMVKTALRSFGFCFRHLGKVLGLYYLVALAGIALFVVFVLVKRIIPGGTGLGMLFLLIWQQLYALSRVGIKLVFAASQTALYSGMSGSKPVVLI